MTVDWLSSRENLIRGLHAYIAQVNVGQHMTAECNHLGDYIIDKHRRRFEAGVSLMFTFLYKSQQLIRETMR